MHESASSSFYMAAYHIQRASAWELCKFYPGSIQNTLRVSGIHLALVLKFAVGFGCLEAPFQWQAGLEILIVPTIRLHSKLSCKPDYAICRLCHSNRNRLRKWNRAETCKRPTTKIICTLLLLTARLWSRRISFTFAYLQYACMLSISWRKVSTWQRPS